MPDIQAGRVLRYAGGSAYSSASLAIMGHMCLFLVDAVEGVWECKGDGAGPVLSRLL